MTSERLVKTLEKLGRVSGKNAKVAILKAVGEKEEKLLKKVLLATYDWRKTYGLRWSTKAIPTSRYVEDTPFMKPFFQLLDRLTNRELTGNDAKDAFKKVLINSPSWAQIWLVKILNRDLKIGAQAKTFNSVWKDLIPEFSVMLCGKYESEKLEVPYFVERKLDGTRAWAGYFGKQGWLALSRGGFQVPNSSVVLAQLQRLSGSVGLLFDGELFYKNWNETRKIIGSDEGKGGIDAEKLLFYIWDIVPFEGVDKNTDDITKCSLSSAKLKDRKKLLSTLFNALPEKDRKNLRLIDSPAVQTQDELMALYDKYLQEGYEGMVIKHPNSTYRLKRSDDWMKFKPTETDDFEIIDVLEGRPGTKYEGQLGKLVLDVHGKKPCKCGSGFSDKQRKDYWKLHKEGRLVGGHAEVKYQSKTINDVLLFPRVLRVRPPGDK